MGKSGCSIETEKEVQRRSEEKSVAVHGAEEVKEVISVHVHKEEKQNGGQGGHFAGCGSDIT